MTGGEAARRTPGGTRTVEPSRRLPGLEGEWAAPLLASLEEEQAFALVPPSRGLASLIGYALVGDPGSGAVDDLHEVVSVSVEEVRRVAFFARADAFP